MREAVLYTLMLMPLFSQAILCMQPETASLKQKEEHEVSKTYCFIAQTEPPYPHC